MVIQFYIHEAVNNFCIDFGRGQADEIHNKIVYLFDESLLITTG